MLVVLQRWVDPIHPAQTISWPVQTNRLFCGNIHHTERIARDRYAPANSNVLTPYQNRIFRRSDQSTSHIISRLKQDQCVFVGHLHAIDCSPVFQGFEAVVCITLKTFEGIFLDATGDGDKPKDNLNPGKFGSLCWVPGLDLWDFAMAIDQSWFC